MLVNIDLRSTLVKNQKFSKKKIHKANNVFRCKFYFDPIIILEARGRGEGEGGYW